MPSSAMATYPWAGAFRAAEAIVGQIAKWVPIGEEQESFLKELLLPGLCDVGELSELESIATWNAEELNKFFADRGFSIRLDKFNRGEYGLGSTFELLLEWETPGVETSIKHQGQGYPAVLMAEHLTFFQAIGWSDLSNKESRVIAGIQAANGDKVYMAMMDKPDLDGIDLARRATQLQRSLKQVNTHKGLFFPQIDFNHLEPVDWLVGFGFDEANGTRNVVKKAFQQNILKVNERGALAKSAAGVGMLRCAMPRKPALVISEPFLFWISRGDMNLPLFVAYLEPDSWKDPGEL